MLSFVKNYKTNVQCPIFKNYLWFADFFKGFLILCQSCQDVTTSDVPKVFTLIKSKPTLTDYDLKTISHRHIFLHLSKVWSMLHHRSVGQVQNKECYFILSSTFLAFWCCFSSKNLPFYHFHFFLWWSIRFPQNNINQSETWIGGTKLSLELH